MPTDITPPQLGPVFKIIPTGINYIVSQILLSGTLQGTSTVTPAFFHYLADSTKENVSILKDGTYSFEVLRDSRWGYDGSYLTVIGSITYLDGTTKDLVGRLNTYMGGVIFSEGPFDFSPNDFITNSFDSFLNVGQFWPSSSGDIGKKFIFAIARVWPTYSIVASTPSVNEGSSVSFQITTSSVEWGSTLNYSISGISGGDLTSGTLNGSTTIIQNGDSGTSTLTFGITADQITEGAETLTISIAGFTASTVINDTSKPNATYSLSSSSSSINEGATVSFTLTTANLSSGTSVPFTLSGVSSADVSGGALSGNAVVNSSGLATISVSLVSDGLTEGAETLTLTAGGTSVSTTVNDTLGMFTYDFGGANDSLSKCLIQSDGKIVLIGSASTNFAAVRLNSLGGIDTSFGTNGALAIDYGGNDVALSGVIQTDGKIILSGSYAWGTTSSDFALARLLTNGTLDSSFGTNGKVIVNFSQYDTADSIALQSDGKILIGGHTYYSSNDDFIAIRLDTNGVLDNTFSDDGLTNTDLGSRDMGYSITSLPNQYVLLVGESGWGVGIVKYSPDGQLDSTFGQGGKVVLSNFSYSAAIKVVTATDGKIFIGSDTNSGSSRDFSIIKLNSNGSIDTTYANQGRASFDFNGRNDYLSDLILSPDGKIYLTGSSSGDFSALRINANGSLDTTFGTNGQVVTDLGGSDDTSTSAALQDDGKLVVSGKTNGDFAVLRYNQSGILDLSFANSAATYTIALSNPSNVQSVNEGLTATFTLTTTNIPSGTIIPYSLSGINSADLLDGALSGNAVINSSGLATISITLVNDVLTEGSETLTITAGGASASTTVNDTSRAPTYILAASSASINEGSTVTFTLTTANVASGTSIPYTLSGVSSADIAGGLLSGNAAINLSPLATISVTLLNDVLTEGAETLTVSAAGTSASTTVNDTSMAPTYALAASSASVNEGATVTFTLTTANVASGTSVPYTLSGVNSADVSGGSLSGNAVTDGNGLATISVTLLNDVLTEGAENLTITAGGTSTSTTVNDSSRAPTYGLAASSTSVNEGATVTFTLTTANVARGTSIPYTLSGVSNADVSSGSLSGNMVVDANGLATISVVLVNDVLTEGSETLTVTAAGSTAFTTVNDTSRAPTYALAASSASVNEGATVTFTLTTANVASGTFIPYTLSGINSADVSGGSLQGYVLIDSAGLGVISVGFLNDELTEGPETLTVSAASATTSSLVNDTSRSPNYSLSVSSTAVNEGSSVTFTLTTINVATGTSVPYTLSGVSNSDISGGLLSGNTVVNSSGLATISVTLTNDVLTEGAETLTVVAGGASASTTINDTSRAPTYALSASSASVDEGATVTFTLTTANLASGTSVPYTLSGVNSADVSGGSLSGNAVTDGNGLATISVTLLNDVLTEGAENLTITAGGTSTSTTVNDSSRAPTYGLAASSTSVNEGATVTFTLTTANVARGTSIPYTLSGVDTADVSGGALSGNLVVNAKGLASVSVTLVTDVLTEGAETLTITVSGASASSTVNDTSRAPTYTLAASSASVDEGTTATFTLTTVNVATGNSVPYTLSGVRNADVLGGVLSGNTVINSSGMATISVNLLNDALTEGAETLTVTAAGASAFTTVNDTSRDPTYTLTASSASVDEGATATFELTTTNVAIGTSVPYILSGVSNADVLEGSLIGSVVIDSSGRGLILVGLLNDSLSEGSETLTVTAKSAISSSIVNDTSRSLFYSLSVSSPAVNEGSSVTFTLTTTNVASGTVIPYTLSGISAADVSNGSLYGSLVLNSSGIASFTITLLNDAITEGSETISANTTGASISTVVNDTSKEIPTYSLLANASVVDEGSVASFVLTTTGILAGTAVPYTIYGVSNADITDGKLLGSAIVDEKGQAQISIPIAADKLKEGSETLAIKVEKASAFVLVADTSVPTDNYLPSASNVTSTATGSINYYYTSSIADLVVGTPSVDIVKEYSNYASNEVSKLKDGSWQVKDKFNTANTDILKEIDRIEFQDLSLALDFDGPAGMVAKILRSVFGTSALTNTTYAGIGLAYLDDGMSYKDLCGLAANAADLTNADLLLSTLLLNVTGSPALTTVKEPYLKLLDEGVSIAEIVNKITDLPANTFNGKLIDLSNYGLLYTPYSLPSSPRFTLTAHKSKINEGETASFTLIGKNVPTGESVNYILSGVNSKDVENGLLTNSVTLNSNGIAIIEINLFNDETTEGTENLTVTVDGVNATTIVNDSSKAPSYLITASSTSVNEGARVVFTLKTSNVSVGTAVPYSLTGISPLDVVGGLMSGTAVVNASGIATISVSLVNDFLTEGNETLTINVKGMASAITIVDTSKSPGTTNTSVSVSLSPLVNSVNEGEVAKIIVASKGIPPGTLLKYSISGVSSKDVLGDLTQYIAIDVSGKATIEIATVLDGELEEPEMMYVSIGDYSTSIVIYDLSVNLAGVPENFELIQGY